MIKLLLVDDEYYFRENFKMIFNRMANNKNFEIIGECENGSTAISFIKNNKVDLIISDVCMPIMDGVELAKYVNNNYPYVKVLIMSSFNDYNYIRDSFKADSCDYILKHHLNENTLLSILTAVFEPKKKAEPALPQKNTSILDANAFIISIENEKNLLEAVYSLNIEKASQCVYSILKDISFDMLNVVINEIIIIATKLCSEYNLDITYFMQLNHLNNFSQANKSKVIEQLQGLFSSIVSNIISSKATSNNQKYVNEIKQYIQENYTQNITLKSISRSIGLSEQYISKLFKDEEKENISNYITKYRIDKAKILLLKENMDIKQIYSDVGFNTYNYFFIAFKKHANCTPLKFKKINQLVKQNSTK